MTATNFHTASSTLDSVRRSNGFQSSRRSSASERGFVLHGSDLRAVVFTFAVTAVVVFAAALACDLYFGATIVRGARSLQEVSGYRLALDLLPWFSMFTALIGGVGISGILVMRKLKTDATENWLQHRAF